MAVAEHAITSVQSTVNIVTSTDKRDVSDMLDLLAIDETPFLNRIGWGEPSSGQTIEWISEDLGPGYVGVLSVAASGDTAFQINTVEGMTTEEVARQIVNGSLLYVYSATDNEHGFMLVTSAPVDTSADDDVAFEFLTTIPGVGTTSLTTGDKIYVLGAAANEASRPRMGRPRNRVVNYNLFSILREDVQISGSMKETEMYAIGREDLHQIQMRLKEVKRGMEKQALYGAGLYATSATVPRSATVASLMRGCFGLLYGQANVDTSTTVLTKAAVDTLIGKCWENGSNNLTFFGDRNQVAKFTSWDINRIRMAPNESLGGGYISRYLSDVGVEIELVPLKFVPTNIAFLLDTTKIKMRAKKNRKAIMEKLGKTGDLDEWQIISEFSMEMMGYNLRQHAMFTALT